MPHSIRYNQEEHIIEIHIQGLITLIELKAVISDVSQAVIENHRDLGKKLPALAVERDSRWRCTFARAVAID